MDTRTRWLCGCGSFRFLCPDVDVLVCQGCGRRTKLVGGHWRYVGNDAVMVAQGAGGTLAPAPPRPHGCPEDLWTDVAGRFLQDIREWLPVAVRAAVEQAVAGNGAQGREGP